MAIAKPFTPNTVGEECLDGYDVRTLYSTIIPEYFASHLWLVVIVRPAFLACHMKELNNIFFINGVRKYRCSVLGFPAFPLFDILPIWDREIGEESQQFFGSGL